MRVRKPSLKRIVAALLLGCVTTIAVAWTLAIAPINALPVEAAQYIKPHRDTEIPVTINTAANSLMVLRWSATGRMIISTAAFGPETTSFDGGPFLSMDLIPPESLIPRPLHPHAFPWLTDDPWPKSTDAEWRLVQASGWPLLSMVTVRGIAPNFTTKQWYGIEFDIDRTIAGYLRQNTNIHRVHRVLPLLPLWTGFLVNTAFYAALG